MQKLLLAFVFILAGAITAEAQSLKGDEIIGVWLNEEKDAKIQIYKVGQQFVGKLVWMKEPMQEDGKTPKRDVNNPKSELRNRALQNLVLLTGFQFKDGMWDDGKIYDPKSGKTYSAHMKMSANATQTLNLRGYVGFSALGRTTVWTKSSL